MLRFAAAGPPDREKQRGATAVEFALVLPLLVPMLLGVVDFGLAFAQNINLQAAAREGARQGVTQGDVLTYANQAKGLLDGSKLQVKFAVDTSGGEPGVMVVCARYPQSSATGFFSWILEGTFEAKSIMKMEGTATVASGASNWGGGSCAP